MRFGVAGTILGGGVVLAALAASLVAVDGRVAANPAPRSYAAAQAEAKTLCHEAFGSRLLGAGPASVGNVRAPARTDLRYPACSSAFPGVSTKTFAAYCDVAGGTKSRKLYAIAKGYAPVYIRAYGRPNTDRTSSAPSEPASSGGAPFISAPTPAVQQPGTSPQIAYAPPPYIDQRSAQVIAQGEAKRQGGGIILKSQLLSLATANRADGTLSPTLAVSPERMVWLVWIYGPYHTPCYDGCPNTPPRVHFVLIDAKTGELLGGGAWAMMPGAPAAPATS